jgi:hypothetical protein
MPKDRFFGLKEGNLAGDGRIELPPKDLEAFVLPLN